MTMRAERSGGPAAATRIGWAALLWLASPAAGQQPDTLLVGVLRADGIAVPYAAYAEGRWTWLPWDSIPTAVQRRSGEPWYLIRPDQPPLAIRGGSVVRFTGGDTMYEEWGVVTDHAPRKPADGLYPIARLGAVLSRPGPAVAFLPVEPGSPEAERHLELLRARFDGAEAQALTSEAPEAGADRGRLGHPGSLEIRRRATLRLTTLYRSADPVGEGYLTYAVLRRVYPVPAGGEVSCEAISELGAWVHEREGELSLIEDALTLDNCTEMQLSAAHPHAAVLLDGRTFLLIEHSAYEGSEHAVLLLDGGVLSEALPPRW